MKKLIVTAFVLFLMACGAVGASYLWRALHPRTGKLPELRAVMKDEDATRAIEPSPALRVNEQPEATVFAGTPVWFTVSADNAAAMNEIAAARALAAKVARLTADVAQGKAPSQELDRVKADYQKKSAPAAITLGDAAHPWSSAVQFLVRDAQGGEQPLSLPLKPIGNRSSTVVLDTVQTVQANFGAVSANLSPETYSVVACLAATGSWQGRVCSDPVNMTVLARPDKFTPEQQLALDEQKARFGLLIGDYRAIESYGRKLVDADQNSIPGHIYLGEARLGDVVRPVTWRWSPSDGPLGHYRIVEE